MRVVGEHPCTRHHATHAALLRCRQPGLQVDGRGPIAVLITCAPARAALYPRLDGARTLVAELAVFGCGSNCVRKHALAAIDLDSGTDMPATPPSAAVVRLEQQTRARVRQEQEQERPA